MIVPIDISNIPWGHVQGLLWRPEIKKMYRDQILLCETYCVFSLNHLFRKTMSTEKGPSTDSVDRPRKKYGGERERRVEEEFEEERLLMLMVIINIRFES